MEKEGGEDKYIKFQIPSISTDGLNLENTFSRITFQIQNKDHALKYMNMYVITQR